MLQKIKLILLISTTVLLVSCYKDKGNYDYKSINEVAIKFDKEKYSVYPGDKLVIKPIISNTQKKVGTDNFYYRWFTYVNGEKKGQKIEQVLGTKKDLSIENVRLKPGSYKIHLYVRDKETGVEWQNDVKSNEFQLEVNILNYEGWLVLNEVNGGSRLDMVTLFEDGKYIAKHDILKILGSSLKLKGLPRFVTCYEREPSAGVLSDYSTKTYGIYISTSGNGTNRIDQETFDWKKNQNIYYEFTSKPPPNLEIDNLDPSTKDGRALILSKKGDVYFYNKSFNFSFSVPYNRINGKKFKASAIISDAFNGIVYDDTNKQFVKISFFSFLQSCEQMLFPGFKFNWKTGKDLVYIEKNNYTHSSQTFAILKDTANNYFLAQFSAITFLQSYYSKIDAPDFDKATAYAFSPEYGSLFYAVGGKVYRYNFLSGPIPSVQLVLDKGSEVITLLKFHDFISSGGYYKENYTELQNKLIVCSYDPSKPEGSNGTMELYSVPSASSGITLYQSYTGFGKIKSVSYRERIKYRTRK